MANVSKGQQTHKRCVHKVSVMKRRDVLAGASGVAVAALAGCLGAVGMDEHESTPGGVDPAALEETGYEQTNVEEMVVEEDFERFGYSETVTVTNYLTEHEKAIDLGPLGEQRAAVFLVLTTPQISLAGRDFNPIADMDTEELVNLVTENYDDIENVEHDRDNEIEILDQDTIESRFAADAKFDGRDVPVYMHVSESVETSADLLVTIGVYPQQTEDEEDNVVALMRSAIEEAEADAEEDDGSSESDEDTETEGDDGGDDEETETGTETEGEDDGVDL